MHALTSIFLFQAEDGIRDVAVTGVQTCALPILRDTKRKKYSLRDVDFFAIYYREKDGFFILKNDGIKKSIELTSPKYSKFFNNFAQL